MLKVFRLWDSQEYWYADHNMLFHKGYEGRYLHELAFTLENVEQFTGKVDCNGVKIFENDVICNEMIDETKFFKVIWSPQECGFRKVPVNKELPITKIDEAFMSVKGTIRDY